MVNNFPFFAETNDNRNELEHVYRGRMFDPEDLIGEFDPETRIVHLTARRPVRACTLAEGRQLGLAVKDLLKRYLSDGRGYLLTDYSKIILEPIEVQQYSRVIKDLLDTYLHPGGIARYGFQISRIIAQLGHEQFIGGDPNLFDTREAAVSYLKGLIARNLAEQPTACSPSPPETA
jgi:hypothetical protein